MKIMLRMIIIVISITTLTTTPLAAQATETYTTHESTRPAGRRRNLPPEPPLSRVDPTRPMIALTFDDGPGRYTTRVLDVFEAHDSRATFFVMGDSITYFYETIERMHENGFEVAGHSWNHPELTRLTNDEIKYHIIGPHDRIESVIGPTPRIFRAPFGATNDRVLRIAREAGFALIGWSVDPRDWELRDAQEVTRNVLQDSRDGSIVVLHDIHKTTAQAMERVVPKLVEQGYQLVTVSELFYYRGIPLNPGQIHRSAPPRS